MQGRENPDSGMGRRDRGYWLVMLRSVVLCADGDTDFVLRTSSVSPLDRDKATLLDPRKMLSHFPDLKGQNSIRSYARVPSPIFWAWFS